MIRAIALSLLLTGCGYLMDMGAEEHQARLEAMQGQEEADHRACSVRRGLNQHVGDYAKCRLALEKELEARMDANARSPRPTRPATACSTGRTVGVSHEVCN